jgi:hypothetical protein
MASAHIENSAHSTGYDAQRLHTNDMEIGVTDAVQYVKLCPSFHKILGAELFGSLLREFGSSIVGGFS